MENDVLSMHEIFSVARRGVGPTGKVVGTFRPTGIRPKFMEKLKVAGIVLPPKLFETTTEVE
jgi:pilus assembly protein CpaF